MVDLLIEDGRGFVDMFRRLVHGDMRPPPTGVGMQIRQKHEAWRESAMGLAAAHVQLLDRHRAEQSEEAAGRARVIAQTLGPVSTEEMLANIEDMKRRAGRNPPDTEG